MMISHILDDKSQKNIYFNKFAYNLYVAQYLYSYVKINN